MEGSELLKYQLNLMTNDQPCIGFNVFFHQQFFNSGTANSKKNLEQTEKIIEQWRKLTDEDKMQWQQKEEELKQQVKSKNNQKTNQSQNQSQNHLDDQNRQKSKDNKKEYHNAMEDIQNSIKSLKFDEAKQNYIKRISDKNGQKEVVDLNDDNNVEQDQQPQLQKNSKKNTQRKKQENKDDDDNNNSDSVIEIKKGRKSNVRQSKPKQSRSRCKSGQRSGCGKRRM